MKTSIHYSNKYCCMQYNITIFFREKHMLSIYMKKKTFFAIKNLGLLKEILVMFTKCGKWSFHDILQQKTLIKFSPYSLSEVIYYLICNFREDKARPHKKPSAEEVFILLENFHSQVIVICSLNYKKLVIGISWTTYVFLSLVRNWLSLTKSESLSFSVPIS